jgi:hypothetical protein
MIHGSSLSGSRDFIGRAKALSFDIVAELNAAFSRAMIRVARDGCPKSVLESEDIAAV